MIETIAAVADGSEKPCQRPMIVTSYGRGRWNAAISTRPMICSDDDAAEEREQVPPALEDDGRDEQDDGDDGHRPSRRHPVDAAGDRRQPAGADAGDGPQHGGVDLVGDAPGPRRQQGDDQPGHEHDGDDDPAPARPADAARAAAAVRPTAAGGGASGAPSAGPDVAGRSPVATVDAGRSGARGRSVVTTTPPRHRTVPTAASARSAAAFERRDRRRRQARRDGVDHADDVVAPSIDDLGAHQRRDVLGRLQPAVVGQLDEVELGDRRVGREQQGDVDVALPERLVGQRAAGVERDELVEPEPVHVGQPGQAEAAGRALRRAAEA